MTSDPLPDLALPYQTLAWLDDLLKGKYDLPPQIRYELFLDGLWHITLWINRFSIPPAEEPLLFQDTQHCIIRAFRTAKDTNNDETVFAINESVEWLAYALVRSSHPQLGNDFERVTSQWQYLMSCASCRKPSTREPLPSIVA